MFYGELKEKLIRETQNFIQQKDWSKIRSLLNNSPQQLFDYADFAFFELNSINNEELLGPHIFIRNNEKYLTPVYEVICEVIKANKDLFSEKFKNFLCLDFQRY